MSSIIPSTASNYLVSLANEALRNGKNVFEYKIAGRDGGYEKIAYNWGRWSYEKTSFGF